MAKRHLCTKLSGEFPQIEQPAPSLSESDSEPVVCSLPTNGNGRRSTLGMVESPEVEELSIAPATNGKAKAEKKKTKNRTYTLGSHQEQAIAKLAHELNGIVLDGGDGPRVNESELVRAAVRLLLDLPRPALLDVISANKTKERQEGWGTGRPRPGKAGKRG